MDNLHSLRFFWPESVLTVAVLSILVQDLIFRRSTWRVPSLVVGALFWLALTGVATAVTPRGDVPLFGGLLQHEPLRMFFAWLFLGAAVLTVIIVPKSAQISVARMGEFIALLFAPLLGMFLMASSTDLLMIYLSVETVSLVSYVLTSFRRADRKANEAALKYVIYGGVASGVMLYGMSILYGLFATTRVTGAGGIGSQLADVTSRLFMAQAFGGQPAAQLALAVAVVFVLAGVRYKIASVPFLFWCPDLYEGAPTPFAASLSGRPNRSVAALALTVFLFSLTGIPPFAGFAGKYLIFAALVQQGGFWNVLLAVIGVLNSAVSLFYYARIIKAMYLEDAVDERPLAVPAVYTGLLVALAVPVLVLGIYWAPLVRWAAGAFGSGNLS